MTVFLIYVAPNFPNIKYFEVYGGIWDYIRVFGGIWRCMNLYKGIWRYMEYIYIYSLTQLAEARAQRRLIVRRAPPIFTCPQKWAKSTWGNSFVQNKSQLFSILACHGFTSQRFGLPVFNNVTPLSVSLHTCFTKIAFCEKVSPDDERCDICAKKNAQTLRGVTMTCQNRKELGLVLEK